jgi:beta-galactosidase
MKRILTILAACLSLTANAQRSEILLEKNWKFHRGDADGAHQTIYDDNKWQNVTVPHDWAIYGPFSRDNDLQYKAVVENGETKETWKTGRTGGLPYEGVGWYRTTFDASKIGRTTLIFDGAMSEAQVYVNGEEVIFWPYGYSSFHVDVTDYLTADGKNNTLAVRLENRPSSSRWYPGAGLYRNVHVLSTGDVHIPVSGTQLTTPHVKDEFASVSLKIKVENAGDRLLTYSTVIYGPDGKDVTSNSRTVKYLTGRPIEQTFLVEDPQLWSPETPNLYLARTTIKDGDNVLDIYDTRFGIRTALLERGLGGNTVHDDDA